MPCLQKYTVQQVKEILKYSEGDNPSTLKIETKTVPTLFGNLTIALNNNEKTGHAQARHLLITEQGLRERTVGNNGEGGLPQASAFLADKLTNLIYVITALLNCKKGQAALAAMDANEGQGKTRVVIVEEASVLSCAHISARVFYQGEEKSRTEKLVRAAIVLDSNLGGKHPFKIVTAFPCKEDPALTIGMSDVMTQARDISKAGNNPFVVPVKDLVAKAEAWTKKSKAKIPNDLLHGNVFVLGETFTSGWFKPNPALYAYKYPPVVDRDADERLDKKPSYEKVPAAKPAEKRMSLPMLEAQAEAAKVRIVKVDYGKKLGIMLNS